MDVLLHLYIKNDVAETDLGRVAASLLVTHLGAATRMHRKDKDAPFNTSGNDILQHWISVFGHRIQIT
jgi:hypothetical protein